LGSLRKNKMKLKRPLGVQTRPSAVDGGGPPPKNQPQSPTTVVQKVHMFSQEGNSNITREWSTANKMSLPQREELTQQ